MTDRATMPPNALASYVPHLVDADDSWRLRVLLHDFGLVWQSTCGPDRPGLIADEPMSTGDARWDAFLGAYAEHLAWHAGISCPEWATQPSRYLEHFWIPVAELATLRAEAIVHAPAAFEAHRVLIADRELDVV